MNETELSRQRERDLAQFNFPKVFSRGVDYAKIDRVAVEKFIEQRLEQLVPEDDIIVEFVNNLVLDEHTGPKDLCLQLKPFLDDQTVGFVEELWKKMLATENSEELKPLQTKPAGGKSHKKRIVDRSKYKKPYRRYCGVDRDARRGSIGTAVSDWNRPYLGWLMSNLTDDGWRGWSFWPRESMLMVGILGVCGDRGGGLGDGSSSIDLARPLLTDESAALESSACSSARIASRWSLSLYEPTWSSCFTIFGSSTPCSSSSILVLRIRKSRSSNKSMFNDGTITTGTWKFLTSRSVTLEVTHDRVEAALVGLAATTTRYGRYSEYMSFNTSLVPPTASSMVILSTLFGFKIAMMYFMMFSVTTLAYSGELRMVLSLQLTSLL
ncbi:hypothetical protein OGAPHI_003321 [Ogataea philodendri]|uniref:U1 small nuclear ribonucleoprotein component SNU71 n=2 Tax=Ogataea TaxID=461281 RepID=A0A9P8P7Q0_9ASCO|nr:uncharacterized protein OGAPHI_003321 [Ogataea philodendri]KAH3666872.1 hypothetical protein OGAPHI_003321 [Ogataea philodendri]